MTLTPEQEHNKILIEKVSELAGIDGRWAVAIAMTESSLGLNQKSPTGAKGIFQMTTIAMMDMLISMQYNDDDVVDILCGVAFLKLLYKRSEIIEEATAKYCAPKDRGFYVDRVKNYMKELYD